MGTSELVEKIRSDGRAQVTSVEADRDRAVAEIRARAQAEVGAIESESRVRTERERSAIVERARGRARLEQRNAVVAARWMVLDRVRELAGKKITSDPGYPELVSRLVQKHARPESEVRLSEADTRAFGARLGKKTGKPAAIAGGVLIRTGKQELNFSLSEGLQALGDSLAAELSRILFQK